MSDETHRETTQSAEQKRRAYLREKAQASVAAAAALGIAVLFAIPVLLTFGISFLKLLASRRLPDLFEILIGLLVLGMFAGPAFLAWTIRQHFTKKAASLPYVPPVREQIATLPADEILLRGSEEPAAAPGELLRAAQGRTETGSEELLRAENR